MSSSKNKERVQCAEVERRNDCRLQSGEGAIGGGAAVKKSRCSSKGGGLNWRLAALIDVRTTFATQGSLSSERPTRGRKCTSACPEDAPGQLPFAPVTHRLLSFLFGSGSSVPGFHITPAPPCKATVDRVTVSPPQADKVARPR